ncbi:MAG: flagellar assembly protein FliH [Candidatus Sedimenticola sp. PURPLELP]
MEKNSSKVISGQESTEVRQWQPPDVGGKGGFSPGKPGKLLTADQLQQLQKQAYNEGYEQGRKAGFEFGHKEALAEGREQIKQLDELMEALNTPLRQLDEQVESELVELVISMVRQLVRREVRADPGQIVGVVRDAVAILPVSSRDVRLVVNPDDAQMVREVYEVSEQELGWKIVEDPLIARGGCRVMTATSQVDATLESRLNALVAPILSGERDLDDDTSTSGG